MVELVTDLDTIKRLAVARYAEFMVMGYMLRRMEEELSDAQVDALVDEIAAPVIDAIDCTACANCCRSLHVYLTEDDARLLADGIDVPLSALIDQHINREAAAFQGEWGRFDQQPCAFLDGNLCSVYPHRPDACRAYPAFTPDFRWLFAEIVEGAALCPIIYHTLDRLLPRVEALSRGDA